MEEKEIILHMTLSAYPLESFFGESAGGLRLDRPEPEAAGQEDRSPDQICCHPLTPVLLANPDHLDREHLVGADLLKDVAVLMPELVLDGLDGLEALVLHLRQLLLQAQAKLFLQARVVDSCSDRPTCSSVVGNPACEAVLFN